MRIAQNIENKSKLDQKKYIFYYSYIFLSNKCIPRSCVYFHILSALFLDFRKNGGNFYSQILDPQKNCLEIFLYKNCSVLRNKNHEHILKEIILHGFSVVLLIFLCLLKHKFYLNERINMYVNDYTHTLF